MRFRKILPFLCLGLSGSAFGWTPDLQWGQQQYDFRCSNDSLAPAAATGRTLWSARQHGEELAQYYTYITAATTDYASMFGTLADTLDALKKEWLYLPNGAVRPRPKYPLWGSGDNITGQIWAAPTEEASTITAPAGVAIRQSCTSSCFRPEVRVFFPAGYTPIKEAFEKRLPEIVTLDEKASLENLSFKVTKVGKYSTEVQDAWNDITHIRTASGGELLVTTNHPLLDGQGVMREAHTLQVGDDLIRSNGGKDPIVSLETKPYFGKVYNVSSADPTLHANVIVAEGFLTGNAWYQNDGAIYLNRDIFRHNLPDSLVY